MRLGTGFRPHGRLLSRLVMFGPFIGLLERLIALAERGVVALERIAERELV